MAFAPQNVHALIERKFDGYLDALMSLCRFPGISSQGFRGKALLETADFLQEACPRFGFDQVERLEVPGSAPFLLATANAATANAKNLLVYAHYDVQPIGKTDLWLTPAFSPTIRDGRLFARGSADDKVGVLGALAAVDAIRGAHEPLPVNVKLILDGEEESGSPNMEAFLREHKRKLKADYLIVPDLVNPDMDKPSLTFSLRGLIEFKIKISVMKKAVHSGLASGVVPDPTQALAKLYAEVIGPKGEVKIPGVALSASKIPKSVRKQLAKAPLNLKKLAREFQFEKSTQMLHRRALDFYQALWMMPALTLVQTQVAEPKNYANRLQTDVEAIFSLRISPLQKPQTVIAALQKYFTRNTPYGLNVEFVIQHQAAGCFMDPEQAYFAAALDAVSHAYQKKTSALGAGLTIPFVEMIQRHLGKMGTILLGVEDPQSNAHAENESVAVSMVENTIRSMANLIYALA